jgi:hypothetical protein
MWDVLAIAPTDDPKVIRRAYAARLKQIDPDRDRETFARLRQALEWALARAAQPRRTAPPRPEPDPAQDASSPVTPEAARLRQARRDSHARSVDPPASVRSSPPAPPEVAERARRRAVLIDLETALQRGDARAASQLYVRAAAVGALPLGEAERVQTRLFTVALEDRSFDGATFRDLARTCGWDKASVDARGSDLHDRVSARLAAEDWYDGLVAQAEGTTGSARYQANVARLVLRRMRRPWLGGIRRPDLAACLQAYWPHKAWLADRIDPNWVMTLQERIVWRDAMAENRADALKVLSVMLGVLAAMFLVSQGAPASLFFFVIVVVINLVRRASNRS